MTSAKETPPPDRTEAAKSRLAEAVARLERALRERPGGASDAADVEAWESVNASVADRLDGAIERLNTILEK
jgi:hypothetical protein